MKWMMDCDYKKFYWANYVTVGYGQKKEKQNRYQIQDQVIQTFIYVILAHNINSNNVYNQLNYFQNNYF